MSERASSPVSPLATVLAPVREALDRANGCGHRRPGDCQECHRRFTAAHAVLDSLDGTITLSRSEAAMIQRHIVQDGFSGATKEEVLALLAARIEESK